MKYMKRCLCTLIICLTILFSLPVESSAALEPSKVSATLRPSVTILVDGQKQSFYDATGKAVYAIFYNGTHYLPVRAIGELMGKNVNWDSSTKTISLTSPRTSAATVGRPSAVANDSAITVEQRPDITIVVDGTKRNFTDANGSSVYPLLNSGTNYLPIRAIGELMQKTVNWDAQTKTITLTGAVNNTPLVTDADTFNSSAPATTPTTNLIGEEAAKSAALNHANLTLSQVNLVQCQLDWDDGLQVYDIEFYTADGMEYDYEIDACTGAVHSVDHDMEHQYHHQQHHNTTPSTPSVGNGVITQEQAQNIALEQVPGASASNIYKAKLDREDGEYEIEIIYNGWEYEFEIDAYTGKIIKKETERH